MSPTSYLTAPPRNGCREGESNSHDLKGHQILSLARLPSSAISAGVSREGGHRPWYLDNTRWGLEPLERSPPFHGLRIVGAEGGNRTPTGTKARQPLRLLCLPSSTTSACVDFVPDEPLQGQARKWSGWPGSNWRPLVPQTSALPLRYSPKVLNRRQLAQTMSHFFISARTAARRPLFTKEPTRSSFPHVAGRLGVEPNCL